jgi:LPXTG-motif cell wall-anchored protein
MFIKNKASVVLTSLLTVLIVLIPSSAIAADPTVQAGTITVGSGPTGIAITADGEKAYVTNYGSNNVSVINLNNGQPGTSITVGTNPTSIEISPTGGFAYVTNYNDPGNLSSVSRIDLSTGSVTSITHPSLVGPVDVVFSPDGSKAYVSNQGSITTRGTLISVISTSSNAVTETITVPQDPQDLAISADGNKLFVSHPFGGQVSIIDVSVSPAVVSTPITGLTAPQGLALVGTSNNLTLYVAEKGAANRVSVYDATTFALKTRITGFVGPQQLTLNGPQSSGTLLFVANRGANNVRIIDVNQNTLTSQILSVGSQPFAVTFAPNGLKAYVANAGGTTLSVITYYQPRTLSFATTSYTLPYGATQTVTAAPSSGAGTGTFAYSAGSSTACTVNASTGVVTMTAPSGTCSISASITQGGTTVNDAYQAASTTTSVTITPQAAPLGITAGTQTVVVGGTITPSYSITSGALISPDALSGVTYTYQGTGSTSYSASTTPPTAVGTYSVTPAVATFSSGSASNYAITYNPGSLVIQEQPTAITISVTSQAIQSGVSPTPQFSITAGALNGTDSISGVTYTYQGLGSTSYAASTTAPTAAGTYSVTPSNAVFSSGSSASYTITYAPGTLTLEAPAPTPNTLPKTGTVVGAIGVIALALMMAGFFVLVMRRISSDGVPRV